MLLGCDDCLDRHRRASAHHAAAQFTWARRCLRREPRGFIAHRLVDYLVFYPKVAEPWIALIALGLASGRAASENGRNRLDLRRRGDRRAARSSNAAVTLRARPRAAAAGRNRLGLERRALLVGARGNGRACIRRVCDAAAHAALDVKNPRRGGACVDRRLVLASTALERRVRVRRLRRDGAARPGSVRARRTQRRRLDRRSELAMASRHPADLCVRTVVRRARAPDSSRDCTDFGALAVLDGFRFLSCAALLLCGYFAASARRRACGRVRRVQSGRALRGDRRPQRYDSRRRGAARHRRRPPCSGNRRDDRRACRVDQTSRADRRGSRSPSIASSRIATRARSSAARSSDAPSSRSRRARSLPACAPVSLRTVITPLASVQALGLPVAALAVLVLWRTRSMTTPIDRWCMVALAAWIAIPNPYPWYALWLLPLAAFAHDRRVRRDHTHRDERGAAALPAGCGRIPVIRVSLVYGVIAVTAFAPLVV